MAHRHEVHKKAKGGGAWSADDSDGKEGHNDKVPMSYNAKGSPALKEAEERKRGGKTMKAHGGKAKHSIHRPGRKRGGAVGSEKRPLTGAAHGTDASGHKTGDAGDAEVD